MTDMPAAAGSGRAPSGTEPGLIRRHELVAALDLLAHHAGRGPGHGAPGFPDDVPELLLSVGCPVVLHMALARMWPAHPDG
jgi:hypothetical protein